MLYFLFFPFSSGLNTSPADDLSSDNEAEKTLESRRDLLSPEEEDDADYTYSSSEENEALASQAATNARSYIDSESDDVSISAFVPEAVRQQCKLSLQTESCSNILALARKQQQQQLLDTNNCSFDSMEDQHIQQDTFDDSDISAEGTSVDDALDEALDMDTDDRVMEKTPINYSAVSLFFFLPHLTSLSLSHLFPPPTLLESQTWFLSLGWNKDKLI